MSDERELILAKQLIFGLLDAFDMNNYDWQYDQNEIHTIMQSYYDNMLEIKRIAECQKLYLSNVKDFMFDGTLEEWKKGYMDTIVTASKQCDLILDKCNIPK